jgi:putative transposase
LYQGTSLDVPQDELKIRAASAAAGPSILGITILDCDTRHIFISYPNATISVMAIPSRHADRSAIPPTLRTFFVTSSIAGKRNLLQSERCTSLFIDVLYHYRLERKYLLHSFVVMPDHFHVLITIGPEVTIERAAQFIKGGFTFRAGKQFGFRPPVWQRGFSEVRIYDPEHLGRVQEYIAQNPVKRRLVQSATEYAYSSACGRFELDRSASGAKALKLLAPDRHA